MLLQTGKVCLFWRRPATKVKHICLLTGAANICCRISSLDDLGCANGLLLADLSWNSIEQVPQGLPPTLISLNLGHNKLVDLPSTLSALALLPKLRILQLKVALLEARAIMSNNYQHKKSRSCLHQHCQHPTSTKSATSCHSRTQD